MGVILKPWENKKFQLVEGSGYRLNPLHPLNRGLMSEWILNNGKGPTLYPTSIIPGFGKYPLSAIAWHYDAAVNCVFSPRGRALSGWTLDRMLAIPNSANLPYCIGDFSLYLYLAFSDSNACTIIGMDEGGGSHLKWMLVKNAITGNALTFHWQNPAGTGFQTDFGWTHTSNQFYDVLVTRIGDTWQLYLDGVAYGAPISKSGTVATINQILTIGSEGESWNFMHGPIGNVAIWNRGLSAWEAWELFKNPYGTESNPRFIFPSTKRYFVPSGNIYDCTLSLDTEFDFLPSGSRLFSKALSLDSEVSQSESALANMLNAMTLAAEADTAQSPVMNWIAGLALQANAEFSPSVIAGLLSLLTLPASADMTQAGFVGAHIYDESLSFQAQVEINNAAQRFVATSLGLDVSAEITEESAQVLAAQIALRANTDIEALSRMAANALLSMGVQAEFIPAIIHSFELSLSLGIKAAIAEAANFLNLPINPEVILQVSRDGGFTFGSEEARSLGRSGEFKNMVFWDRLGVARNAVFRIVISDPVKVVIENAVIDKEEGTS